MGLVGTGIQAITSVFLLFSIFPVVIFGFCTTGVAVAFLAFRVAIVYTKFGIAMIAYWCGRREPEMEIPASTRANYTAHEGWKTPTPPGTVASRSGYNTPAGSLPRSSTHRFRSGYFAGTHPASHRGSSIVSLASVDGGTPIREISADALFTPSAGLNRDFEGLGGYRIEEEDDTDDSWTNINSRLELSSMSSRRQYGRSHSLGPVTQSERVWLAMVNAQMAEETPPEEPQVPEVPETPKPESTSPVQANSSRVRAKRPPRSPASYSAASRDGYFEDSVSPRTVIRPRGL